MKTTRNLTEGGRRRGQADRGHRGRRGGGGEIYRDLKERFRLCCLEGRQVSPRRLRVFQALEGLEEN